MKLMLSTVLGISLASALAGLVMTLRDGGRGAAGQSVASGAPLPQGAFRRQAAAAHIPLEELTPPPAGFTFVPNGYAGAWAGKHPVDYSTPW